MTDIVSRERRQKRFRLESLPESEQLILASLPFKVGVWTSHAADEQGDQDDKKEMRALECFLDVLSQGVQVPPVIRQICLKTLEEKPLWDEWAAASMNVPAECQAGLAILAREAEEIDVKRFRMALYKIARTVAEAYGEFNMFDDNTPASGGLSGLINRVGDAFAALGGKDDSSPANISPAEEEALRALAAVLKKEGD